MIKLCAKFKQFRPKYSENTFYTEGHSVHDLQNSDLKLNRGPLLSMANLPTKFCEPQPKCSLVTAWKQFSKESEGVITSHVQPPY